MSPLLIGALAADVQSPRLIVRAVGGTRDFAVFACIAATWHPRFDIEFAIGRPAQISRSRVDHAIRNPKSLKDFLFDPQDILVQRVGILQIRPRVTKHFHLCKLVHAIDASSRTTRRTGFGTKTVRKPGVLQRQRSDVEGLILLNSTESNLGRCHETQVAVGNRINLSFIPARVESNPLQNRITCQVRRRKQREAFATKLQQRILHERHFEHHGIVLQEVKS